MEILIGFLAAAFALTGSPGPNTLSLAAVGAAFGWQRGLSYMLGLTLGMAFVIALVGSGVVGLLLLIPGAGPVITLLAAGYFVYLAYRIATAPPLSAGSDGGEPPGWLAAIFVSLANPKAYAAMAAMFSGFVLVVQNAMADAGLKSVLLMAVILTVNIAWLLAGAALTPLFRNARTSRMLNICFAVALLLSVAAAVLL